ncbi:CGNR zinc finger domain-containing protein [Streptomyces griseus]|uniref:CGNR zinc finger domain-containing protein n=1 Tax=Streptomyces stephensoniae TaxID=3375367 RepID=A0ABU2W2P4_9ACTN|nr:CGNR zinc finger domain-containing protein [Streptomyces griseus]MDT0492126.1 CGNR zinc finger domain-containing protein [Streptomyces griseus]
MAAGRGAYVWRFDSGRICLDLVATGPGGAGRGGREQLDGPGRLADWLTAARLVPPGTALTALDTTWLTRFRELRADVERLMAAQLASCGNPVESVVPQLGRKGERDALDRVNSLAAAAPPGPRAVRGEGGALVRTLSAEPDCAGLLAVVARDAVDLLTDPVARAALRRCAGGACDRLYLDTSRGGRRRWCSGEVCGNRERVARHRRRTAGSAPVERPAGAPVERPGGAPEEKNPPAVE